MTLKVVVPGPGVPPPSTEPRQPEADPKLVAHQPYLEIMGVALSSPNGLKVTKGSPAEAKAYRMRCYAARRYVQRAGLKSFDKLSLTIDGNACVIRKDGELNIEFL